jgi:hypothetical protein
VTGRAQALRTSGPLVDARPGSVQDAARTVLALQDSAIDLFDRMARPAARQSHVGAPRSRRRPR